MKAIEFEKDKIVDDELQEFADKVEAFKEGTFDPEEFKLRRLIQGIYGQRQPDMFMIRVKIPAGHLTSDMINGLCDVADQYANGILHITTRQDFQLYYVSIDNLIPFLSLLAEHKITTREASGATIRNIITSAFADSLRDQEYNILPTVETVVRYFLRNEETQHLPRKFKLSFSENEKDLAVTSINDMGLIAATKDGKPGFKMVLGGSLGSTPMFSRMYKEFIDSQDLLWNILAVLRAFNRHGNRAKRAEARLKFQFEKMGFDEFCRLAEEQLQEIKAENMEFPEIEMDKVVCEDFDFSNPYNQQIAPDKYAWFENNVIATNRKNEYMIVVQVPLGDLKTDVFRNLNEAHKEWHHDTNGEFITLMDSQNLVLKGCVVGESEKKNYFNTIYKHLSSLGLNRSGYNYIGDPVSCLGSATCASGITHSPGLAEAISQQFHNLVKQDKSFTDTNLYISGCSNSCARHHVATIGFSGRADKTFAEGQEAPAYNVFYGGATLPDGEAKVGTKISEKLLAKRIPAFLNTLIGLYKEKDKEDDTADSNGSFHKFIASIPKDEMTKIIKQLSVDVLPISKDETLTFDWGVDRQYVMEYGEGECL